MLIEQLCLRCLCEPGSPDLNQMCGACYSEVLEIESGQPVMHLLIRECWECGMDLDGAGPSHGRISDCATCSEIYRARGE